MKNQRSGRGRQIFAAAAVILAVFAAVMWASGGIGLLRQSDIPDDAHKNGGVPASATAMQIAYGDRLTALVFYDPDNPAGNACTSMVYLNRTGFFGGAPSVGWFFRASGPVGGNLSFFTDENGGETAYYSSNQAGCVRAEFADGRDPVALDPARPFALVADCPVTFYTADNTPLSAHPGPLG